jgi:hypothetical protein
MWLHEHALNHAREKRGQLAVNGLWFWGGGAGPASAAIAAPQLRLPALYGADPWLHGLARLAGQDAPRPGGRFADITADDALVVVSAAPRAPGDAPLQRIEADWFAPVLEALRAGRIEALHLRMGGWAWQIPVPAWQSWLRRPAAWWEWFS